MNRSKPKQTHKGGRICDRCFFVYFHSPYMVHWEDKVTGEKKIGRVCEQCREEVLNVDASNG